MSTFLKEGRLGYLLCNGNIYTYLNDVRLCRSVNLCVVAGVLSLD